MNFDKFEITDEDAYRTIGACDTVNLAAVARWPRPPERIVGECKSPPRATSLHQSTTVMEGGFSFVPKTAFLHASHLSMLRL